MQASKHQNIRHRLLYDQELRDSWSLGHCIVTSSVIKSASIASGHQNCYHHLYSFRKWLLLLLTVLANDSCWNWGGSTVLNLLSISCSAGFWDSLKMQILKKCRMLETICMMWAPPFPIVLILLCVLSFCREFHSALGKQYFIRHCIKTISDITARHELN